ncbi:MAG: oxygen-independent coproporphyrinogen III oxidase-like protein [Neisseriaceae bacterium]|nr:oxygen-independent coproporphyrinogen III oxidase-like protein [Neisseriaceae bacterium]
MKYTIPIFTNNTRITLPPLSLYIHIPYCVKKCPYCDFNSHAIVGSLPEKEYIEALIIDLQSELPYIWGRRIGSIFIGGGTPSIFSAKSIEYLLNQIRSLLPLEPDAEITLEANPITCDKDYFQGFRDAGVNRLSLGIQSFSDKHLSLLGRVHNSYEARFALEIAKEIFPHVNADLMYALPQQTYKDATNDIQIAIDSGVEHVSAYQLTIEEHTAFGANPPVLPDIDECEEIELSVHETLIGNGFERYEISAFAKNKAFCRHNLNYWQFGDYVGIGTGAHGKISFPDKIERTVKNYHPKEYIASISKIGEANLRRLPISKEDLPFEFMLNALRLLEGVPLEFFTSRTNIPFVAIEKICNQAKQQCLMIDNPKRLCATEYGIRFLNDLLALFLP